MELIVQPGAKDGIGEMGVRGDWPCSGGKREAVDDERGCARSTCYLFLIAV